MGKQTAIKFCGLTRPDDAVVAASLGAAYLGVIFAPSARRCTVEQASALYAAVDQQLEAGRVAHASRAARGDAAGGAHLVGDALRPQRVGVFAHVELPEIARIAKTLALDVIQLHEPPLAEAIGSLRSDTGASIWSVLRVGADGMSAEELSASERADGILLDTKVDGQLGGTGRTFDWVAARDALAPLRSTRPVILAGGLHPDNVAVAIATFAPDVVDVSSGVEQSPGVKDHARMRAFADAVRGVSQE